MKRVSLIFIAILFLISSMASVFAKDITRPPVVLKKVETVYPIEAQKQGIEGKVVLKVFVSEKGEVPNIEIVESSGHDSLDQAAIDSVKRWIFIPADVNGKKCASDTEITVVFMLKS